MPETTTICPPPEELAALVDHTLGEVARTRLMEHLAECETCFEVFSETVRFNEELEADKAAGTLQAAAADPADEAAAAGTLVSRPTAVSPMRSAMRYTVPFLAAAAIILAAGLGLYRTFWGVPSMEAYRLADLLEDEAADLDLSDFFVTRSPRRGPGDEDPVSQDWDVELKNLPFMAGVRLVDLHLALMAEDTASAATMAGKLERLFASSLLMAEEEEPFARITLALQEGTRTPQEIRRQLVSQEKYLAEQLEEGDDIGFFSFGKWTEAARLAAEARQTVLLVRRDTHRFLDHLLEQPPALIDEQVHSRLEEVRSILSSGELQEAQLEELRRNLREIVRYYL